VQERVLDPAAAHLRSGHCTSGGQPRRLSVLAAPPRSRASDEKASACAPSRHPAQDIERVRVRRPASVGPTCSWLGRSGRSPRNCPSRGGTSRREPAANHSFPAAEAWDSKPSMEAALLLRFSSRSVILRDARSVETRVLRLPVRVLIRSSGHDAGASPKALRASAQLGLHTVAPAGSNTSRISQHFRPIARSAGIPVSSSTAAFHTTTRWSQSMATSASPLARSGHSIRIHRKCATLGPRRHEKNHSKQQRRRIRTRSAYLPPRTSIRTCIPDGSAPEWDT